MGRRERRIEKQTRKLQARGRTREQAEEEAREAADMDDPQADTGDTSQAEQHLGTSVSELSTPQKG